MAGGGCGRGDGRWRATRARASPPEWPKEPGQASAHPISRSPRPSGRFRPEERVRRSADGRSRRSQIFAHQRAHLVVIDPRDLDHGNPFPPSSSTMTSLPSPVRNPAPDRVQILKLRVAHASHRHHSGELGGNPFFVRGAHTPATPRAPARSHCAASDVPV